ncbi:alpha/beta fold hydrolase (plasmid) [Streptomyces sp. NBC_01136]|uniref:thioesterase II family protein n=1 Tax=unclassified Streptomyces TaxID=2593676 RepID=UPI002F910438|nr:alpha/beta fold hydrolase [Streptomyces sp. NBC_01136]
MVRSNPGWIRPLNEVARPAARVVCLPHSGGSATSYSAWATVMPPDVELLAVQYPGRGDRCAEPLMGSIGEMSAHIAAQLLRLTSDDPAPYALFGHSLGAMVAYETALVLRDRGCPPAYLFVSGSAAPGERRSLLTHRATDEELWSSVCALGGIDPAIAQNPELRELVLPALRADVRAGELYRPAPQVRPLPCPVRCYHSPEDPLTRDVDMSAWAARTTGPFSTRERPGGHFHLWIDTDELVGDILSAVPRRTTSAA